MERFMYTGNKNDEFVDVYFKIAEKVVDKMRNLEKDSLIRKSIAINTNKTYKELLYKTLDNLKDNKRHLYNIKEEKCYYEEPINIDDLLDDMNDNVIEIDKDDIEYFSPFDSVIKELLKFNLEENHYEVQGWQFLTLYEGNKENNICIMLCILDDDMHDTMTEEEREKIIEENDLEDFIDIYLYGLAVYDWDNNHREYFLDIWNG